MKSSIHIHFFKLLSLFLIANSINALSQIPNCAVYTAPADGANGNGGRTTLTWTAPGSGSAPTGYKLFFGTDVAATNIVNGTNLGNVFTYNADALTCNTTYYWKMVPTNGSGDAAGCSTRSFVIAAPANPLTTSFGSNSWTTFVYNSTNFTNYVGYYTNTGTPSFNSNNAWDNNESPSGTTVLNNYLGCRTGSFDNFSFIHKRQGFTNGTYKLEVQHDDAATLMINGAQVYQRIPWTNNTWQTAWVGNLNASSTIEFTVTEGSGGAHGKTQFTIVSPATSVTAGVISSSQTVCNGATVALTGSVATSNPGANACFLSYQWQSSTDNVTFNNVVGATSQNYTTSALSALTYFRRIDTDACGNTATTNTVTIGISAFNAGTIATSSTLVCSGSVPASLTSTTDASGGSGGITYQWQYSDNGTLWVNAPGAGSTNNVYTPILTITATRQFRRQATSCAGSAVINSNVITFTITPVLGANTITAAQSICTAQTPASLAGNAALGGDGTYVYQWQSSNTSAVAGFADIVSANGQNYAPGALTATIWYRRVLTSGGCTSISTAVQITVNPVIANNSITRDQSICTGQTPLVTLAGTIPIGGSGTYAYQWESSTTSAIAGFSNIGAATAATYPVPSLTQTTWYRRTVTSGGCSNTSTAIQITVYASAPGTPSVFGNNIWNVYAYSDAVYTTYTGFYTESSLSFATTSQYVAGVNPSYAPNYQGCAITTGSNVFSTSMKRTNITPGIYQIDIPAKDDNVSLIINGVTLYTGTCCAAVTNIWTGAINAASQVEIRWDNTGGSGNLSVNFNTITQPTLVAGSVGSDQNLCSGNNPVAFTSTASATGCSQITYQWQSSIDNVIFVDFAGATSLTYDAPAITATNYYRRKATDACNSIAYTPIVTVSINPSAPFPSQAFGNGTWNIYCYQDPSWTNYGGYYTTSALSFDSRTQWDQNESPSSPNLVVAGYLGCQIPIDNFSILAKRTGFAAGIYQIDVPYTDDGAYLYINGILVYTKPSWGAGPNNVWTGSLNNTSTVEFRMTEGGGGASLAINVATVTPAALLGGTIGSDQSMCYGNIPVPFSSVALPSGGCYIQSYQWQQSTDGGTVWSDISGSNSATFTDGRSLVVPMQYRRRATDICGTSAFSNVVSVSFTAPPGNPALFGTNTWNGYAYQDSTWSIYAGYYTEPTLSFNTTTRFTNVQPPSFSSGYIGCQIFNTIYSMSYKRQGVPVNGIYQIDIPYHDDDVYLYVDGSLKFSFIGCCAARTNVWMGLLNSTSQIEFRYKNGNGPGQLQVSLNIVVPGTLVGGSIGTNRQICTGESIGLTNISLASGSCTPNYQWQSSLDNSVWSDISGALATTYTTPALSATTYYRRKAMEPCGSTLAYSNVVTLAIAAPSGNPAVFGSNVWNAYAYGTNTFTSYLGYYVTNSLSFDSYTDWNSNFSPNYSTGAAAGYLGCQVPVDNFSISFKRQGFPVGRYQIDAQHDDQGTLFINGVQVYTAGYIGTYQTNVWTGDLDGTSTVEFRMAENTGGAGARLLFTIVTPSTAVVAGTISGNQTICFNAIPTTFTNTALATSGCYVYYQWQSSPDNAIWSNIVGATSATYTSVALTSSTYFRRNAVNACGVVASSASILVTVNPTLVMGSVSGPSSTCSGVAPAAFTSTTLPSGGNGTYTYQWQSSLDNVTFANIGGATATTLSPVAITQNTYYRRGAISCSQTVYTSAILVSITPATAITTQPFDASACTGNPTSFTVSGNGFVTYQWQEKVGVAAFGNITNAGVYSGATSATLNISNVAGKGTNQYRVLVTGVCAPTSITSSVATLNENAPPIINTPPAAAIICNGANATFALLASGTGLTYQWQENGTNVSNAGVYSGVTTTTLTLTNPGLALSGRNYRCVVTSSVCSTPVNTATGLLTVSPVIANNTITATTPACSSIAFTITGNLPTGGSGSYTYIWENSTTSAVAGFATIAGTGINSNLQTIIQTTWYRRTTNSGNCSDVSTPFQVNVTPTQAITVAPAATSACTGSGTTFTVTATNAVSYQWQENNLNISNVGVFSGTNSATLSISDVTGKNTSTYRVLVTGCSSTTTSAAATLSVPSVTINPSNVAVCQGTGTSFTVAATGAVTYQWQVNTGSGFANITNTSPYSGITTATLTINNSITAVYNGYLYRALINGCANATSTSATLNVYPQISTNSISSAQNICTGDVPTSLTGSTPSGAGGTYTYQWQSSIDNATFNPVGGATFINYAPAALSAVTYYRRTITSAITGCNANTSLPSLTISVNPATTITTNPATTTNVCNGSNTTISVVAAGQGLGYQWQVDNGGGYVDIINGTPYNTATTATLSITAAPLGLNFYKYRARVSGNCPLGSSVSSNFSTLNVQPTFPVSVSIGSSTAGTICNATSVTFTATPTNGGTPAYQWKLNGSNVGPNAATYITTTLANNDQVTVVMTSGITCPTGNPATSNLIAMSVNPTGQWLGVTSTGWNTGSNWCGGVPSSTIDAIIPSGTPFQPTINTPSAIVRNVTINSGATLTLTNNIPFNIYGNYLNNGTYVDGGGIISFLGSASQGVTNMATAKNVTVNNAAGVVLNSNMNVSGLLTLTSGALNSSGRLTVNLTTGNIDKTGTGSITGNITLVRNASELSAGWHYLGSPLSGTTFNDLNDNVTLTAANFYGYNEGDGNINQNLRWKNLVGAPLSLPLSTAMAGPLFMGSPGSLMTGYALKFPSAVALDLTGTYTHGAGVSYTTGNMSYTNGGPASDNGWQLIANPFPSYIDWNSAAVSASNLEAGITYHNNSASGSATYLPATTTPSFPEVSTNGGSPFIPAMQALWVQVKSVGNGVVTINNNARIINPSLAGYPTAPSYYREARTSVQSFKLVATNSMGSDETCLRFGKGATTKFDSNIDMNKLGNTTGYPRLYTVTDTVEYAVNSLPELSITKEVNLSLYVSQSGNYTISIKELLNMEEYANVNLYDKQTNRSHNLMISDTYSFTANIGDAEDRFVLTFQPEILTNTQTLALTTIVDIFSIGSGTISLWVSNSTSEQADVIVTNVLGQQVYKEVSVELKSGRADMKINNIGSGVYIVKAIIDGRSYAKEVMIMK